MWVPPPLIKRLWGGGFHHSVTGRILGNNTWRQMEGTWDYPPLVGVIRVTGIEEIKMYISRQKNTMAQYIATHSILDICLDTERRPVLWTLMR